MLMNRIKSFEIINFMPKQLLVKNVSNNDKSAIFANKKKLILLNKI